MAKPRYGQFLDVLAPRVDPFSEEAGNMAQMCADTITRCAYSPCDGEVVGCAVHEERPHSGTSLVPVCERHKGWEMAKLQPSIWDEI